MDSDKVIVMDGGQAVEFDHPHQLLQDSSSYFCRMVDETGPELAKRLRKVAEDDFKSKYSNITYNSDGEKLALQVDNEDKENMTKSETSNRASNEENEND